LVRKLLWTDSHTAIIKTYLAFLIKWGKQSKVLSVICSFHSPVSIWPAVVSITASSLIYRLRLTEVYLSVSTMSVLTLVLFGL
jgi:hypothetical protein